MKNIKLTVAYDGTNYCGFQEQRGTGLATIQEELEKALSKLAGSRIQIIGAGRTDAGVHARGQVVNFRSASWPVPTDKIHLAMNAILPRDIAVLHAQEVPEEFHSRFSATAKTYRYSIYHHRVMSPLHRLYFYHEPRNLNIEAMTLGAQLIQGTHDFKCFQAQGTPVKDTVRTIFRAELTCNGPLIFFDIRGNGFLYNMVRIITGTLLEIGVGKKDWRQISDIIASRDRTQAGTTVPPQGLTLERVEYDPE